MNKWMVLLASTLLAGCGNPQPPAPSGPAPTNAVAQPAPSFGSAAVDVFTQRDKIEAGKRAKATVEAVSAKEQKDLEAVMNE